MATDPTKAMLLNRFSIALAFTLFGASCATSTSEPALPEGRIALRLVDETDRTVSLASQRGRVVLLHVVATWSDLSLIEVPLLASLQERYPDELVVWGVSLDNDPRMVRIFRETFEVPYPVLRPDNLERFTGPSGPFGPITIVPTSVLLDRDGRIAARMDGLWTPESLIRAVTQLVEAD